jgi:hypothetical protein
MWLDVPETQEQDAFRQNQVRELVLGRFDSAIRVLILRENGNAWTRIGIGQYTLKDSVGYEYPWANGTDAFDYGYYQALKGYQKRTIRLT